MGVYIKKGIDMPSKCLECPFATIYAWGFMDKCDLTGEQLLKENENARGVDCPLVEVKAPHGRLIDADKLTFDVCTRKNYHVNTYAYSEEKINNAQTVIEAEG